MWATAQAKILHRALAALGVRHDVIKMESVALAQGGDAKFWAATEDIMSTELVEWLMQEAALNKQRPVPNSQLNFWCKPRDPAAHDPRGCAAFLRSHIDPFLAGGAAARPTSAIRLLSS